MRVCIGIFLVGWIGAGHACAAPDPWGRPVTRIRLECDAHLRLEDFAQHIVQKVGEPLERARIRESLKRLAPLHDASGPGKVEDRLGFDLRAQGTPDDVTLLTTLGFREVSVNGASIGDLHGQIDWKGEQIRLEGQLQGSAGTGRFAGVARAEGDWPLELSGQYANLRADPWIRTLLEKEFTARVTTSGAFTVTGPLKKLNQLEVQSRARSLEVSFPSLTWKNDQPVDFHYTNRTLVANRFKIRGPSTDLEVEGSVHFNQPAALSLTAQGTAEAALLALIDPALQATGQCKVKLRVSGSLGHPLFYGTLSVQGTDLGYGDLPFRLTGLKGEIAPRYVRYVA